MSKIGYALVLSGGGAKGVYHIGVWRALKELGIKIDAVIGNSIGALAAGFIAQDNYDAAINLFKNMGIDKVLVLPEELVEDGQINITGANLNVFKKLQDEFQKHKGLDNKPLIDLLKSNLDEKKIRESDVDLGILTFRMNDLKPRELFIEDFEEGHLIDYLLASATFPGFKITNINNQKLIDGGVYNNIPFSMAKDRGYKRIIVVDISGVGLNKTPDYNGTITVHIKNSINMGTVFDFDPKFLNDYMELGYLDTLKAFDKFDGIDYFYYHDEVLYKKLNQILLNDKVFNSYKSLLEESKNYNPDASRISNIKNLLPKKMKLHNNIIICLAECAAMTLKIPILKHYEFEEFIKIIWQQFNKDDNEVKKLEQGYKGFNIESLKGKLSNFTKNFDFNKLFSESALEFENSLEKMIAKYKNVIPVTKIKNFYSELIPGRIFLKVLNEYFKDKKNNIFI